jgi:hypothetical protein
VFGGIYIPLCYKLTQQMINIKFTLLNLLYIPHAFYPELWASCAKQLQIHFKYTTINILILPKIEFQWQHLQWTINNFLSITWVGLWFMRAAKTTGGTLMLSEQLKNIQIKFLDFTITPKLVNNQRSMGWIWRFANRIRTCPILTR